MHKKLLFYIIMLFFITTGSLLSVPVKAANAGVHIQVNASLKGTQTITYVDSATGETMTTTDSVTVPSKSKITLNAVPQTGYRFICWIYQNNKNLLVIDQQNVSFSPANDYTLDAYYIEMDHFVVRFFNNSRKILLGIEEVASGGFIEGAYPIPSLKGYDGKGWDHDLENIQEDLDVTPLYTSSVWSVFRDYYPMFFKGLGVTLLFSVIAVFAALFLGGVLCLMRISLNRAISAISTTYIEIIRGIPLLLQLLLIYALVPRISIGGFITTEVIACILALFLNSAAYVAEIFRSGIQAVDKGQMEAARALGLSKWQAMRKIVLPQAFKNSLPSIGNELIMVIKETSLASTVDAGIGELMSVKKQITSASFINIEPFIVIAIMYFCVTFALSKVVRLIERRLAARD